MLKAVLFDMDGVIVNTEPLHKKAYYSMFNAFNIPMTDAYYEGLTGQSTRNICIKLVNDFNLKNTPQELEASKREYFWELFHKGDGLELIDGVLKLIKDYHSNGLTLILASSASMTTINGVFKHFDLDRYFKAKLSGADLKESKPHPEIFEKAADAAGCNRNECFVIEDSTNGIKAAKAAGIYCVGYDSFHSKNQDYSLADTVISDFEDIAFHKATLLL